MAKRKKKRKSSPNLSSKIRGALRKIWRYGANDYKAHRIAVVRSRGNCEGCGKTAGKLYVDHREPVVCPKKGFEDWATYIDRLFVDASALDVLCKACHDTKSAEERLQRKKHGTGVYKKRAKKKGKKRG